MLQKLVEFGRSFFRRESPATREVLARIAAMADALNRADAFYRPSRFWIELMAENESMLRSVGIENFKRSLSQNYFNFAIEESADPQMQALIAASKLPENAPLGVELGGRPELSGIHGLRFLRTPLAVRNYIRFVGLLWLHALRDYPDGPADTVAEPAVGNPVPLVQNGRRISQDLANSLREYRRLQHLLKPSAEEPLPVLAEIGAGYGRLGYLARAMQPCRYWIFDIPPALAIAEWYLAETSPAARIFRWREFGAWRDVASDVAAADIAIFSVDQLALVPDRSVRAFATISALHEFRPEQIPFFVEMMGRKAVAALYTKNHSVWKNDRDDFLFTSDLIKPPAGYETAFSRSDDVLQSFTEKLFVNAGHGSTATVG
jgi:hypothetical protein